MAALVGTLSADFSSFAQACADADVSLSGFQANAGKVQTSLTKMANSLAGTTLIQTAELMAESVGRIGGVSSLTEAELQRVGAQAAEAAEKMEKMGKTVPPGIQAIADASGRAANAGEGWGSILTALSQNMLVAVTS